MGNRTPAARRRPDVLSSPFQPQPITIFRVQPEDALFLKMPTVFHQFQFGDISLLWSDTCMDILLLKWWVILIFCLVIHFCVMQHQQQHHPPSGTEINAALRAINGGRVARRRVTVREKHLSALVRWFLHWATSPTPCGTSGGILFLEWNLVTQLMYRLFQHLLAFWGWSMISSFAHKNTTSLFALSLWVSKF